MCNASQLLVKVIFFVLQQNEKKGTSGIDHAKNQSSTSQKRAENLSHTIEMQCRLKLKISGLYFKVKVKLVFCSLHSSPVPTYLCVFSFLNKHALRRSRKSVWK